MNAAQHLVRMLRERDPRFTYTEADLWDVLPAARGLTVLMRDGRVIPLPCADGVARQLLHMWGIEAARA